MKLGRHLNSSTPVDTNISGLTDVFSIDTTRANPVYNKVLNAGGQCSVNVDSDSGDASRVCKCVEGVRKLNNEDSSICEVGPCQDSPYYNKDDPVGATWSPCHHGGTCKGKAQLYYIWHYRLCILQQPWPVNLIKIKIMSSIKRLKILLQLSKLLNAYVKMDLVVIHVRRHLAVMPLCAKTELFVWSTVTLINACANQDTMVNIVRKGPAMKTFSTLMVHLPILMGYVTHMAHVRIN